MDGADLPDRLRALLLLLDGELFALDAAIVLEILDPVPVTHVPGAPPHLSGIVNVRGKIVPLADLRRRFDMPPAEATIDTRMVVVEVPLGGEPILVALLADKVKEVADLDTASFREPPPLGMRWRPEFVRAIAGHNGDFVILPHLERIFA